MTAKPKKAIPAKVVEIDPHMQPLEAEIVSDKRPTFGKRLGLFALALIVLFFAIGGYIQSAKNGSSLHRAAVDRSKLVDSLHHLARTNDQQTQLIKQLQEALRKQNALLEQHGIKTVVIPGENSSDGTQKSSDNSPKGYKQDRNDVHKEQHRQHHHHKKSHNTDNPSPLNRVTNQICDLTGICVIRSMHVLNYQQQALRRTQIHRPDPPTGVWWAIFRLVANLGTATWG